MFPEQQISKLDWFLKDHVTEDWSNDDENSALHDTKLLNGGSLYKSVQHQSHISCLGIWK